MNSCNLALFGVTGDPVQRLMIPALHNLAVVGLLPDRWPVAGVARRQYSAMSALRPHFVPVQPLDRPRTSGPRRGSAERAAIDRRHTGVVLRNSERRCIAIAGAAQYSPGVVSTAWNSSVRITFKLLDGPVCFDRHCPVNDIDSGSLRFTPTSMKRRNAEKG